MEHETGVAVIAGVASGVGTALLVDGARALIRWRARPRFVVTIEPQGSAARIVLLNMGGVAARGLTVAVELPASWSVLGSKHIPLGDRETDEGLRRTWQIANAITLVPGPRLPLQIGTRFSHAERHTSREGPPLGGECEGVHSWNLGRCQLTLRRPRAA